MKEELQFPSDFYSLAGKANTSETGKNQWLPVWMHLEDTAGVMDLLIRKWMPVSVMRAAGFQDEAVFRKFCLFIAYVHDIGKLTPAFASKIYERLFELVNKSSYVPDVQELISAEKSPHTLAGEAILQEMDFPEEIICIVGAHHGKPRSFQEDIEYQVPGYPSNYCGPKKNRHPDFWRGIWKKWVDYAFQASGISDIEEIPALSMESQMIITGLVIMSDWIASNEAYFPLIDLDQQGDASWYPQRIESAWRCIQLPDPWTPTTFYMEDTLFRIRFGFPPKEVQSSMIAIAGESISPGLYILEAQMGVGKTEAALGAAEILASKFGNGGIFFGLPTQATSNGIFKRLEKWAENQADEGQAVHSIRLAHGMAEINPDYIDIKESQDVDLIVHQFFEGRKTALLSDFVIGTVDQILMAALKQKHVMLRHLGLAGKVVIIDECHAYDAYMNRYLDRALNWLGAYHVPVVMLSATLPPDRRAEFVQAYLGEKNTDEKEIYQNIKDNISYPLLTWTDGNKVFQKGIRTEDKKKSVQIKILDQDLVTCLEKALKEGGCAGVIVNTVSRAQNIAEQLKSIKNVQVKVIVYHAQFTMADRAIKERLLLSRVGKGSSLADRSRLIVVGTQVLEQSLDIDFDFLITDLCPMDLLLQRIGRLHRHMRIRPEPLQNPTCVVIDGEDGGFEVGSRIIYGEWLLSRTRSNLPAMITLPLEIPELVKKVYEEPENKEDPAWKEYQQKIMRKSEAAKEFCLSEPQVMDEYGSHLLTGLLDASFDGNDVKSRAAVRDGNFSIEVLLLERLEKGKAGFISSSYKNYEKLDLTHVPDPEICREIARQRVKLPRVFNFRMKEVIQELERRNLLEVMEWQQSSILKGELILLLDKKDEDHFSTILCGYQLTYGETDGLKCQKCD